MTNKELIERIIEYLEDNKNSESLDIQSDSKHLLFWIENWRNE